MAQRGARSWCGTSQLDRAGGHSCRCPRAGRGDRRVNYRWIKLPPSIAMLLGSLALSLLIVASDHVFHLHAMSWFRGALDVTNFPRVFLNAVLALLLFAGTSTSPN
jgi:hypothetical protein